MFGCRALFHISRDERSKLNVKSKEYIFLGYRDENFGYRLYNPFDKKVIRSKDVIFLEDHIFEQNNKAIEKPRSSCDIPNSLDPVSIPNSSNQGGAEEAREEVSRNKDEIVVDKPEPSFQLPPPQPL